jgi:lipid II:glycine glycyltransferase (peptidoglycan interpeptide bridge formation enzyme)
MKAKSVRQTDAWARFLTKLGWEIIETSQGNKLFFLKTLFGTLCKIQKPEKFSEKELDEIEEICREKKAIFIKIDPAYQQNEKLLEKRGYVYSNFPLSPPSTIFIDLTKSEEDLWNDLSRSAKYSVRRSKREKDRIEIFQDPKEEVLERLQKISQVTSKRGKFYLPPYKELKLKREAFGKESFVIEVYDAQDRLAGAKFYVAEDEQVTYLQGGTSEVGREGKGGYLLLWDSILYFKNKGYRVLDLEGVDDERFPLFTKNWGGFSHFKEKYGGVVMRFPHPYIKYRSALLKLMAKFHQLPL